MISQQWPVPPIERYRVVLARQIIRPTSPQLVDTESPLSIPAQAMSSSSSLETWDITYADVNKPLSDLGNWDWT